MEPTARPSQVASFAQVFSGDGSLSSGFRRIGWHTLAIDHSVAPGRHKHQPLVCELASPSGQDFAISILDDFGPTCLYIRPPCRTANRARVRSLPSSHPASDRCPPLRSDDQPWGRLLRWALGRKTFVCIECPQSSFFWICFECLPEFQVSRNSLVSCCSDLCMLGGSRPSSVRFVTNMASLPPLLRDCPGLGPGHGVPSSQPTHPQAFVQCIIQACCQATSFSPPAEVSRPGDELQQRRKSDQLMPEFSKVVWSSPSELPKVPHKVLRPDQGAVHGAVSTSEGLSSSGSCGAVSSDRVPVGIFATPAEIVQRAHSLRHPMTGPSAVTDSFKKALFANLTKTPSGVAHIRAEFLEQVTGLVTNSDQTKKLYISPSPPSFERF